MKLLIEKIKLNEFPPFYTSWIIWFTVLGINIAKPQIVLQQLCVLKW